MRLNRKLITGLAIFLLFSTASAQKASVTISLSEPFFDALFEAVFNNFGPQEFSIASAAKPVPSERDTRGGSAFSPAASQCNQSIKVLREMNGVKTSVRFRDGKIIVPLAFSGNYSAPFIGCVGFAGWAESNVELDFDRAGQRMIGRVRVVSVNLSGTGGVGGTLIARMLQSSIDNKVNPVEIIRLDKLAFLVPVRNSGNLKLRALNARPEVVGGALNIHIGFEFLRG
ncbi:MAG: hypothetical protein ABR530_04580 [Pyrinomonadaceae bacterium]